MIIDDFLNYRVALDHEKNPADHAEGRSTQVEEPD